MREMKDSGISWIGEIPKDWVLCPFPIYFESIIDYRGKTPEKVDEGIFLVTARNIKDGKLNYESSQEYVSEADYSEIMHRGLPNLGDVLFTTEAPLGEVANVDRTDIALAQRVIKFSGKEGILDNYFLKYWIYNPAFQDDLKSFGTGSTAQGIKASKLNQLKLILPSFNEQRRIVSFLDSKCAEIDALTADIQSEIETLEECKRSRIFETVEHGLGHKVFVDTDSDVWQTIPEGWKLVDIKYLFEIVKRIAGKEGYDIIAITQQGLQYKDVSSNAGQLASDYSGYQFVYPGDFAMNHMDLITGWVDLSDKFGVTSPDYRVFRLRYPDRFDRKYYKHIMQCCYMCRIFYSFGRGVSNLGRWRLQTSTFNDFKVPVPPYEEQVIIGKYLDEKVSEIDAIITQKREQFTVLADYKKSLIYEYVTGKKEVPVA